MSTDDGPAAPTRRRYPQLSDRDWLYEQYVARSRSLPEIAAELGCDHTSVLTACHRHGIQRRDTGAALRLAAARRRPDELDDEGWLREHYQHQALTTIAIAEALGCHPSTVRRALDGHGIARRPRGTHPRARASAYPRLNDRGWLTDQYVTQGRTQAVIAAEVGCTVRTVRSALARLGVRRDT